jgi:hypothetical protein
MSVTITIEKLTITVNDQAQEPEEKLNAKILPPTEKIAPDDNKLTNKVNKLSQNATLRKRTAEEDKQVKAIQNKKWRLKKTKKLTPKQEAELNAVLAEIEQNRLKPYTVS